MFQASRTLGQSKSLRRREIRLNGFIESSCNKAGGGFFGALHQNSECRRGLRQQIRKQLMKMNYLVRFLCVVCFGLLLVGRAAEPPTDAPYKILKTTQTMGSGGIDYVYADNDGRRLYVPRGTQVLVFNLDTLDAAGSITNARARGVAVDPVSHHGFSSSSPVVMWDSKTLETIKTIDVEGGPDGILFEPLTERVYVFSHRAPNATVIDAKEGTVVGTIDLGGAPEQAQSDGQGHLYVDIEDKDNVAVVDVKTLKVTAHYDLSGKGGGPAGLGLDVKNHILFAMCRNPQTCVVMNADDGKLSPRCRLGGGRTGEVSIRRQWRRSILKEMAP